MKGGRSAGFRRGRSDGHDDDRSVSPQVGLIVLFGLVFLGAALIVLTGSMALDAFEQRSQEERTEQSMDVLRNDIATAQVGEPQRVEDAEIGSDGTITLILNDDETTALEMEIGSMYRSGGGTTYAYQVGGIWKQTDGGSQLVTEPPITHEKTTVVTDDGERTEIWAIELPPIQIESLDGDRSGDMTVSYENRNLKQQLLDGLAEDDRVETLTIEIEGNSHQDAWYRFLRDELGGGSTVEHQGDTVTATNIPLGTVEEEIDYGDPNHIVSTLDAGTIDPPGSIYTADSLWLQHAEVDSFDSSNGPYDQTGDRSNGAIMASGEVQLQQQTEVYGDVLAGEGISGTNGIHGDYNESWDGFHEPDDMTATLTDIVDGVSAAYDTEPGIETPDIERGTHELETGVYYLDSGTVTGDLTLDVSNGHVAIVVEDELRIDGDVTVEGVDSGYEVHWITTEEITIEDRATVTVEGDRTPQNWVHSLASAESTIDSRATFTGVLYTPGNDIAIRGGNTNDPTEVYGGLVGNVRAGGRGNHVRLSFDEDLTDERVDLTTEDGTATSHQAFDATVTFLDSDFATPPRPYGTGFTVDRSLTTVDTADGDLDSLEYWQTASSVADDGAFRQSFSGNTRGWGCWWSDDCTDTREFEGLAGDEVSIDVTTAVGTDATVTISGPGGTESGTGGLETTLSASGTYAVTVDTNSNGASYDLDVDVTRTHETVSFDATQYDTASITVDADGTELLVELVDPNGNVISAGYGMGTSTIEYDSSEHGTHQIRASGVTDGSFEYDLTLKRTAVDGSANVMRQSPIQVTMIFETEDGSQIEDRMTTDTDLHEASDGEPRWGDDMNHPAVEYPRTYEFEELPANTAFTIEVEYREQACERDSFAGTTRTPEGTAYEDDPIFEFGCAEGGDDEFQESVNALDLLEEEAYEDEQFHRVRALEDGDPIPPIQPIEGQRTLQDMLGPYLRPSESGETAFEMDLAANERAFVFELAGHAYDDCDPNAYDLESWGWQCGLDHDDDVPSYNDVVVLFEITPLESDDDAADVPVFRPPDGDDTSNYHYAIQMDGGVITVEGG